MKAFILLSLLSFFVCSSTKSQQFDIKSDLNEIALINGKALDLINFEYYNPAFIEQINKIAVAKAERNQTFFIPIITMFQQSDMQPTGREDRPGSVHRLLLHRIGDINFINFIQRGDFSEFIIGRPGTGHVLDSYVFPNNRPTTNK